MANADSEKLNLQQEKFCQIFTTDRELFGSGTESYIAAYNYDINKKNGYQTAAAAATRLLKNVKICKRIADLLSKEGFNDENVQKQHLFLINQHADSGTKMRAISDFYKLKGKYAPDQVKIELINVEEIKNRITNLKKKVL